MNARVLSWAVILDNMYTLGTPIYHYNASKQARRALIGMTQAYACKYIRRLNKLPIDSDIKNAIIHILLNKTGI